MYLLRSLQRYLSKLKISKNYTIQKEMINIRDRKVIQFDYAKSTDK